MPLADELNRHGVASLRCGIGLVKQTDDLATLALVRVGDEVLLEEGPLPLPTILGEVPRHVHHQVIEDLVARLIKTDLRPRGESNAPLRGVNRLRPRPPAAGALRGDAQFKRPSLQRPTGCRIRRQLRALQVPPFSQGGHGKERQERRRTQRSHIRRLTSSDRR